MNERDRPRNPNELPLPPGLGNPLSLGGPDGGSVTVDYNVYREQLPLAGRTVGEIRRTVTPRFNIDRRARAVLDGNEVDDSTVVRTGQELRFLHLSGEKGQSPLEELPLFLRQAIGRQRRLPQRAAPRITIEGDEATTTSPEGHQATMGVGDMLARLDGGGSMGSNVGEMILPDGVKFVLCRGGYILMVHQTPPAVHRLKWIKRGSKSRHGPGTEYREVRIALPYILVFALFAPVAKGDVRLSGHNECFFRTEPLRSPDDHVFYPALLNCSKFADEARPLSWICTQHLAPTRLPQNAGINDHVRQGMHDLMRCMLETGFNYSSEVHELSSWYSESKDLDPRISTIERWEEATLEDPTFVDEIPWLPVGMSVRQVTERMLGRYVRGGQQTRTSRDVARVICNHGAVKRKGKAEKEGAGS